MLRGMRAPALAALLVVGCFATLGAVVRDGGAASAPPGLDGHRATRTAERVRELRAGLQALAAKDSALVASVAAPAAATPEAAVASAPPSGALPAVTAEQDHAHRPALFDAAGLLQRVGSAGPTADEAWKHYEEHVHHSAAIPSIVPSAGRLSSPFDRNRLHPILHIRRPHRGIDIAAPRGTPILAPARGEVRFAGSRGDGYGRTVEIDHGSGIVTRFAHASRILVQTGQTVERGQTIAEVGASGLATGPHLHYEVLVRERQVDPLQFVGTANLPGSTR